MNETQSEQQRLEQIRKDLQRNARPWYNADIQFLLDLLAQRERRIGKLLDEIEEMQS